MVLEDFSNAAIAEIFILGGMAFTVLAVGTIEGKRCDWVAGTDPGDVRAGGLVPGGGPAGRAPQAPLGRLHRGGAEQECGACPPACPVLHSTLLQVRGDHPIAFVLPSVSLSEAGSETDQSEVT